MSATGQFLLAIDRWRTSRTRALGPGGRWSGRSDRGMRVSLATTRASAAEASAAWMSSARTAWCCTTLLLNECDGIIVAQRSDYGTTRAQFMSWTRRRRRAVSDLRSSIPDCDEAFVRSWDDALCARPDLKQSTSRSVCHGHGGRAGVLRWRWPLPGPRGQI